MSNILVIYILLDNTFEHILQNMITTVNTKNYIVIRDSRRYYDVFFEYIYENYNALSYDKYLFCRIDDDLNEEMITYINTHLFSKSFVCDLCGMDDFGEYKEFSNIQFDNTVYSLFCNIHCDYDMCGKKTEDGTDYYSREYFIQMYNRLFDDFDENMRFIIADGSVCYISKNAIWSRTIEFYKKIIDIICLSDRNQYYIHYFIEKIFTGKYSEWKIICKTPYEPEIESVYIPVACSDPNILNYVDTTVRVCC